MHMKTNPGGLILGNHSRIMTGARGRNRDDTRERERDGDEIDEVDEEVGK